MICKIFEALVYIIIICHPLHILNVDTYIIKKKKNCRHLLIVVKTCEIMDIAYI